VLNTYIKEVVVDTYLKGALVPDVALKQIEKGQNLTQVNSMADVNTNFCQIPTGLVDCCLKPEAYFSCPPYKNIEICVANRSDGAFVSYPIPYLEAYRKCQNAKQDSINGTNKQFNVSFASSFK
jgi:hypothetical protein